MEYQAVGVYLMIQCILLGAFRVREHVAGAGLNVF